MAMGKLFSPAFIGVLAFVAIIHGAWWLLGTGYGVFGDGDSYLRLLRLEQLLASGDWLDISIPGTNAPFGGSVHWTRLFDLVMLALALPVMPFTDVSLALYGAGLVVSPVIHLLTAAAIIWAVKPMLGNRGAYFAGAASAAQAGILAFAVVGRADHHMMFMLIGALATGYFIRGTGGGRGHAGHDRQIRTGVMLGVILAAGIWVGPEFLSFALLVMTLSGLAWVVAYDDHSRKFNLAMAWGLTCGLVVMVLIERGISGYGDVEYDKLSVVHVTFAVLYLLFWMVTGMVRMPDKPAGRLMTGVAGAAVCGATMVTIFPEVLSNPLNSGDAAILPIYAMISEYRAVSDFPRLLIYFGGGVFALPWVLWRTRQNWSGKYSWGWLLLAIGLVFYSAFAINWLRWSLYAALFMSIILGDFIATLDKKVSRRAGFLSRVLLKTVVVFGVAVGPLVLGAGLLNAAKTPEQRAAEKISACPVTELSDFLNGPEMAKSPKIIVASANFGPELVYRTGHAVVATVHHRGASGILDGFRIMSTSDDGAIIEIIEKRRVDLLILCPGTGNDGYFLLGGDENSLYRRLEKGSPPPWLESVPVSGNLAGKFLIYRVH